MADVPVLDHVGLTVGDYARAKAFYTAALAPLGITLMMEFGKDVTGTRADPSGNPTRAGHSVVAHYYAVAELDDNQLDRGAAGFIHGYFDDLE